MMTPIEHVLSEVARATARFPTWPSDPLHALGVLMEEVGELSKAIVQQVYEPHKNEDGEVRKEAVQTAAMALRLVMSLDRYSFVPCEQHQQATDAGDAQEGR
jgi:NTP pyrophosphatase (non-canonical NTP hydrolase)